MWDSEIRAHSLVMPGVLLPDHESGQLTDMTLKLTKYTSITALLLTFLVQSAVAGFTCIENKVDKVIINLATGETEVSAAAPRGQVWSLKESYNGWAVFTDGTKDPRFAACRREFEEDTGFLVGISCAMDQSRYDSRSKLFYSPDGVFSVQIWSQPVGDYQTTTKIFGNCAAS